MEGSRTPAYKYIVPVHILYQITASPYLLKIVVRAGCWELVDRVEAAVVFPFAGNFHCMQDPVLS